MSPTEGDDTIDGGFLTTSLNGLGGFDTLFLDFSGLFEGEEASRVQLVLYNDENFANTRETVFFEGRQFDFTISNFERFNIVGSSGNDVIRTHRDFNADDEIHGGEGNNNISTFGGNDTINTGSGNDTIDAGAGDDTISSGGGNDNINAGTGNANIQAGSGDDYIVAGSGATDLSIDGGSGSDWTSVNLLSATSGFSGNFASDFQTADGRIQISNIERFSGSLTNFDDHVSLEFVTSGLNGGDGFDFLELDFSGLFEGEEASRVQLVLYNDENFANTRETVFFEGRQFDFTISNFERFNIVGSSGNDVIRTHRDFNADDEIHGGGGRDNIETYGGNDIIDGGGENDLIEAGDGDDLITGGAGDDNLRGGAGADTFVIVLGADRDFIPGFSVAEDKIDVSAFDTATAISAIESYKSGTTDVIQLADDAFVEFSGAFDRSTLKLSNFIFSEPVDDEVVVPVGRSLSELLQVSDYGAITSHLALFSKAAYGNEVSLLQLQNQGWALYSENEAEQKHFFSVSSLTALTPQDGFPEIELDGHTIRAGNASLILARTDDAIVVSFTGTDDLEIIGPDKLDWINQGAHFEKLLPVLSHILNLVKTDENITDVYFTGHSLGAAMAEISFAFFEEEFSIPDRSVTGHMHNFASPGYNESIAGDAAGIAVSALLSLSAISDVVRNAFSRLLGLTDQDLIDKLVERVNNSDPSDDPDSFSAWLAYDIINGSAVFGDQLGHAFEVKVVEPTSVEEASQEILEKAVDAALLIAGFAFPIVRLGSAIRKVVNAAGDIFEFVQDSIAYHSHDLYADVFLQIDKAIFSNSELLEHFSSNLDYSAGQVFFSYDGALIAGEEANSLLDLGEDGRWNIGEHLNGANYVDFSVLSVSFLDRNKKMILLGHASTDFMEGGNVGGLFLGLGGSDHIALTSTDVDLVDGGDGVDTLHFEDSSYVVIDLLDNSLNNGAAMGDRYFSIENVVGSEFDDFIFGDSGTNRISGYKGVDRVHGRGGDDFLTVSQGGDWLFGGDGSDTYIYEKIDVSGADSARIIEQADEGSFDTISFSQLFESDVILKYVGDDLVISIRGIKGILASDLVVSGGRLAANVELLSFADGAQVDLVTHLAAELNGEATDSNDVLRFVAEKAAYIGRAGLDLLDFSEYIAPSQSQSNGAQQSPSTNGLSIIYSEVGIGLLNAIDLDNVELSGIEDIIASRYDDIIEMDALGNIVTGGAGNDRILGMQGDDLFIDGAGSGDDVYDGGDGVDSVDYSTAQETISVDLRQSQNNASGVDIGADSLNSIESVFAGHGNDSVAGNNSANTINGGPGNDELFGYEGSDLLFGGAGNDIILGGDQNDNLYGGDGNDQVLGQRGADFLYGGAGDDLVLGGNRNDRLFGEDGNDRVFGGNDQDLIDGGAGSDIGRGGNGDDILNGGADGDVLFGGTGRDTVNGDGGDDVIFGRGGFDILNGGAGDDLLEGGLQADQFIFEDGFGNDTITDFASLNNAERIHLSDVTEITDFQDLIDNHMSQVGADVLIDDGLGNTITLLGVQLSDLDAVDFVF